MFCRSADWNYNDRYMGIEDARNFASERGVVAKAGEPPHAFFQRAVDRAARAGLSPEVAREALEDLFADVVGRPATIQFGEALIRIATTERDQETADDGDGLAEVDAEVGENQLIDDGVPASIDVVSPKAQRVARALGSAASGDSIIKLHPRDRMTIPLFEAAGVDTARGGADPVGYIRRCLEALGSNLEGAARTGYEEWLAYLGGKSWVKIAEEVGGTGPTVRTTALGFAERLKSLGFSADQWHQLELGSPAAVAEETVAYINTSMMPAARHTRSRHESPNDPENDSYQDDTRFVEQDSDIEAELGHVNLTADAAYDYLRAASKIDLLSAEQEVDIAKKIEAGVFAGEILRQYSEGDDAGVVQAMERNKMTKETVLRGLTLLVQQGSAAREQLLTANIRLSVKLAREYSYRGLSFEDLLQEGSIGMIRAVETFDYTKGYKFSTYTMWWIRQAMQRAIAKTGRVIRIPVNASAELRRYITERNELEREVGRPVTDGMIAEHLGISVTKVKTLESDAQATRTPVSLSTPLGPNEGDSTIGDMIHDPNDPLPDEQAMKLVAMSQIESLLNTLSDREAEVIRRRKGFGAPAQSLREIGKTLGISGEMVRQIEARAMAKLSHPSRSGRISGFSDGIG